MFLSIIRLHRRKVQLSIYVTVTRVTTIGKSEVSSCKSVHGVRALGVALVFIEQEIIHTKSTQNISMNGVEIIYYLAIGLTELKMIY